MSLDKAIKHNKEHRKKYHGSKAVSPSCRNHGNCPYCAKNRKHKVARKLKEIATEVLTNEEVVLE